ncbi:UTP--glucose-1-phosphate uridylyltransferase [Thermosporothrix hazakensis]|jgi:UTP--glucose-1-phosphate uridylyltransferase|uniref:UTP--glucose-1-phosphate uridylyltransferase n=2 Tax=Thermosporothrix TaxID=768650 RepID=A0A326U2X6_THEHA|nr:UTP--glucose-1-phosphate uridylyltransferase GalU [Thermosporothrix hazakensis]PZW24727.1 UTP--glucose-1-phosphate uridylyltransferase [Thermosporothrix hazakensis]BBH90290.1 UTP--glucose-1-phosphate uridylyltransferase [Thermosporothrix sp. COM3]GCE48327.1 UTP--glucose-1-phosphate uridylyltransferase [Thermosporothrix hazakensis]
MRIRKAVLPVAGLGTRVLPASKVTPKEMLPLVDKPTLQYIVEEAVEAGIEEIIFVTSASKHSIEDHFDSFPELERTLEKKGKQKELEAVRSIQNLAAYASVRQPAPLGLGHAVWCARHLVGDEPFIVLLGDDLVDPDTPCLKRMIELYEHYQSSVICLFEVPEENIPSLGIASVEHVAGAADTFKVKHLVEKPSIEEAPSNLAVAGRYVFTPDIFAILEKTPPGKGGEIQLTDAIQVQAEAGRCYALNFQGIRYDTGTPLGLLTTSIAYALKRPDIAPALREYMRQALAEHEGR